MPAIDYARGFHEMITAFDFTIILALIGIAIVDARKLIIPDSLSLFIACAAGLSAYLQGSAVLIDAALGALLAFLLFDGTRRIMSRALKREAMGFGDVKLMAAGGLWIGSGMLSFAILGACAAALLGFGVRALLLRGGTRDSAHPFGPYLAFGLISARLWQVMSVS